MKKSTDKKENTNFIRWNYDILKISIKKIDLNIIRIILLDTLFYLALGYLILFWFQRISAKIQSFSLPPNIDLISDQAASRLGDQVAGLNLTIKISFILLIIAIIFLASMMKGMIWSKSTKTKISLNILSKFLVLNLIWMGFWFLCMYLLFKMVQPQLVSIFLIIILFLSSYVTYSLYSIFMEKQNFRNSFASIAMSFRKIHYFLLPYSLIVILWILSAFLGSLISLDKLIFALAAKLYGIAAPDYSDLVNGGFSVQFVVLLVISVAASPLLRLVTAFSRYYFSTLASEIGKRK